MTYKLEINDTLFAIKKLKNTKTPGIDNIPNKLLKYGGKVLAKQLITLFNSILSRRTVPADLHKSITIPIFKIDEKTNPENYNGSSLLYTTIKLFTCILYDKTQARRTR